MVAASNGGHESIVRLLLDKVATDYNMAVVGKWGFWLMLHSMTPLQGNECTHA